MPDRLAVFRDAELTTEIVDRRVASSRDFWRARANDAERDAAAGWQFANLLVWCIVGMVVGCGALVWLAALVIGG